MKATVFTMIAILALLAFGGAAFAASRLSPDAFKALGVEPADGASPDGGRPAPAIYVRGSQVAADPLTGAVSVSGVTGNRNQSGLAGGVYGVATWIDEDGNKRTRAYPPGGAPRTGAAPTNASSGAATVGGPNVNAVAGALCGAAGPLVATAIAAKTGGATAPASGFISQGSSKLACGALGGAMAGGKIVGKGLTKVAGGVASVASKLNPFD